MSKKMNGSKRKAMLRSIRVLVVVILLASLLALIGLYRAYVEGVSFLLAFYLVAGGFVGALWELLVNPIVLVVLCICFILWLGREHWPSFLSALTEVKAGAFSARFDPAKLGFSLPKAPATGQTQTMHEDLDEKTLETVVDHVSDSTAWYILKAANKPMDIGEHAEIIRGETSLKNWDEDGLPRRVVGLTYFLATYHNLNGLLFTLQDAGDGNMRLAVSGTVLKLMARKLQITD